MIRDTKNSAFVLTHFNQVKRFKSMKLTNEAQLVFNTPNAGGSSVESEVLSLEMLKKYFNAKLLKTEMEVSYFPEGGSITDYVVLVFDTVVGVSVTRAMKYNGEFTLDDANALLSKKLKGILQSSRNSLIKWEKQILHVWIYDENVMHVLTHAWAQIDPELKSNTVMIVTLASNSMEIFTNQKNKKRKIVINA